MKILYNCFLRGEFGYIDCFVKLQQNLVGFLACSLTSRVILLTSKKACRRDMHLCLRAYESVVTPLLSTFCTKLTATQRVNI